MSDKPKQPDPQPPTTTRVAPASPDSSGKERGAVPSAEIRQLAAELRAGKVDATQAVDRLIGRATAHVAPGLTETARFELETLLRDLAARDPLLASKLASLTKGK